MESLINKVKIFFQRKKYKHLPKEQNVLIIFSVLFGIFVFRLFYLQVVQAGYYQRELYKLHYKSTNIPPERGNIFLTSKGGKTEKLTESVYMFDLAIDPTLIWEGQKEKIIDILAPIIYQHLCVINGSLKVSQEQCNVNLANFNKKQIDIESQLSQDLKTDTHTQQALVAESMSESGAVDLIKKTLDETIIAGYRERNYIGYFDNDIIDYLKSQNISGMEFDDQDVYIVPTKFDKKSISSLVKYFNQKKLYDYDLDFWQSKSEAKPIRYIKLITHLNPALADQLQTLEDNYSTQWYNAKNRTYIFTGLDAISTDERKNIASQSNGFLDCLTLERYPYRVYPYGTFLSHVLGYVDKNGNAIYGIEQYFDSYMKGVEGKSTGLSTQLIGTIGSNSVQIQQAQNGKDIYLTIDPSLQAFVENLIKTGYKTYNPDDISVLVMETQTGRIAAQATYPNFDPNDPQKEYDLEPLTGDMKKLIETDNTSINTFQDIPILFQSGNSLKLANSDQRLSGDLQKYIFKNKLGAQVFIDKNIRYAYEPGSVFKALTLAIGIDSDNIFSYSTYFDKGYAEVGPFKISNVDAKCMGTHTFLHAFDFSCNAGMIEIFRAVGKEVYYTYLDKFGIGKQTGVQLAMEEPGNVGDPSQISLATMFNNSFGQGLLTTPVQLASAYSALVNGGTLYQPTIVDKICPQEYQKTQDISTCEQVPARAISKVVSDATSEQMREALVTVVTQGHSTALMLSGFDIGGKTGTAQIAYRGKYQFGAGWSNATFIGMLTKSDPRYIVVVRISRPRNNVYADSNAQPIFGEISKYILANDGFIK